MLGLAALIVLIVYIIIVVFITQLLWNYVMPGVFGLKVIEFWQTLALLILTKMFFGHPCYSSSVDTMYNMNSIMS